MKVGLEKLENHEGVTVKALLDSGATGLFMDTTFAKEKGFRMEKLKRPLLVKNVDGTKNAGGAITHQVEWKAAFMTHIGVYEPTVMYFGLTNSSATFQAMMNDLFRDLINQGDTATFIDNILVATDTEEGHDELVEEVLRRLEENDLFVKPEKCR